MIREYNFDGLIGPTHNYAGLSYGNVASASHRRQTSFPRAAALQGLAKMKALSELQIGQAILPPLRRPQLGFLRTLGLSGSDQELIEQAWTIDPVLLATCYSASNMWTANAATVSPGYDTRDGRVHLTTANLTSTLHRSIEAVDTFRNLSRIFRDPGCFCVSPALPSQPGLADEGAANHTRLGPPGFQTQGRGLELFVFGVDSLAREGTAPLRYPARQTRLASEAIARRHGLSPEHTFFLQQSPQAIDAGVFHNDVISVGHQNVLLVHEMAFVRQPWHLQQIRSEFQSLYHQPLHVVEFSSDELSLNDAVKSYLFNSQLVTRPDGNMTLVCPSECESTPAAERCTQRILAEDNPVDQILFLDLRQSMNNGGGPACLRLRVPLTEVEASHVHPDVFLTETLHTRLVDWIQKHYRETLAPDDLRDPQLFREVSDAFDVLDKLLNLPPL